MASFASSPISSLFPTAVAEPETPAVPGAGARERRALMKRQYKEAPPPAGVYVIRNMVNQRVFVGASANPEGSMNRARFELRLNKHRNPRLQQDWRDFGEKSFSFEVIDTLKKSEDPAFDAKAELATLLQLWSHELGCHGDNGYNMPEAK